MIDIRPMAGALGAEIFGPDLSAPLDDATVSEIKDAFHENLVIFFRDQDLTSEDFLRFANYFGEVVPYPMVKGLPDYPDIIPVLKLENERHNFGGIWHSDTTYLDIPPMGSMLVARELPPVGGDTLWANMYMAYEVLSDGMKRMLSGLQAVNSAEKKEAASSREDRLKDSAKHGNLPTEAIHPVVRTHPVTGRKSLFVNVGHTTNFVGMTPEESVPILNYLFEHLKRPEFTCRLKWSVGTVAFWDNRCTQHLPLNDYHGYKRLLHRVTLAGEKPV